MKKIFNLILIFIILLTFFLTFSLARAEKVTIDMNYLKKMCSVKTVEADVSSYTKGSSFGLGSSLKIGGKYYETFPTGMGCGNGNVKAELSVLVFGIPSIKINLLTKENIAYMWFESTNSQDSDIFSKFLLLDLEGNKKVGLTFVADRSIMSPVNSFSSISPDSKIVGIDNFDGKKCYIVETNSNSENSNSSITQCFWSEYPTPLWIETESNGSITRTEYKNYKINQAIDASIFQLPPDREFDLEKASNEILERNYQDCLDKCSGNKCVEDCTENKDIEKTLTRTNPLYIISDMMFKGELVFPLSKLDVDNPYLSISDICSNSSNKCPSSCEVEVKFQPGSPEKDKEFACSALIKSNAPSVNADYEIKLLSGEKVASGKMNCIKEQGKFVCDSKPELKPEKVVEGGEYNCFVTATTNEGMYCSGVGFSKCESTEELERNCCFDSTKNQPQCCPVNKIYDESKGKCVDPVQEWIKVIGSPCTQGWPSHQGVEIFINNKNYACDLFEVNDVIFQNYGKIAANCILYSCQSMGCHSSCKEVIEKSGFNQSSCPEMTCKAMKSKFMKAVGLYDFYGVGCAKDFYLESYYRPELMCNEGNAGVKCRIDARWPWLDNLGLTCSKPFKGSPPGMDEITGKVNKCFFVDLPASVSVRQMRTGTCADYSVVLTTLLRASGFAPDSQTANMYQTGEVYSAKLPGHEVNRVRMFGESSFVTWDTTSNGCVIKEKETRKITGCANDKVNTCPANR